MNPIESIQKDILTIGQTLIAKGLVAGTWGNISTRVSGRKQIVITPSGRDYNNLKCDDLPIISLEGDILEGKLKPSSELPLHLAIYRARSDIQAIVHTHSIFASACSVSRKAIPPVIEDLIQVAGGSIDVAEYALPGTPELAINTVLALGKKNAVLLANHGVVGCGQTLAEAMTACELVEKAAQIFLYATQLGAVHVLSDDDVKAMHEFYVNHYRLRRI